jgi:hypothetical protein
MEKISRLELGKFYQRGLLLEILDIAFTKNEVFNFLHTLSKYSR